MAHVDMLLDYLYSHPATYRVVPTPYRNAVALTLPATLILPGETELFPPNALDAQRLPTDFAANHPTLVAWLAALVDPEEPPVAGELWLTTSHITANQSFFVEVTFE